MEVRRGYEQAEVGTIPTDWEVMRLGEVAYITKLAGFEYTNYFNSYNDGGDIIVVRGTNITNNRLDLSVVKKIPHSTSNKLPRSKLHKDDLVFAYVGTIGPVYLIDEDERFHLGPNTCKISVGDLINPHFLFHYFTSWLIHNEIIKYTSVGAQPSLSMSKIRKFNIVLPPTLPEQHAIATALSAVDGLIGALDKLIAKKRAIKLATMQQLLTSKTRLPGFSEKWEVKNLGEIADILKGSGLSKGKLDPSGKNKCILYGELFTTYKQVIEHVVSRTNSMEGRLSKYGDILMPGSTTTVGIDLATASALLEDNVLLGGDIIILRKKDDSYNSEFLARYLTQIKKHAISELAQGITIIHLYGSNMINLELRLPSTIEEQGAISAVLSDMDDEIAALEQRREKNRAIKQGMMQALLTGRVRLVNREVSA